LKGRATEAESNSVSAGREARDLARGTQAEVSTRCLTLRAAARYVSSGALDWNRQVHQIFAIRASRRGVRFSSERRASRYFAVTSESTPRKYERREQRDGKDRSAVCDRRPPIDARRELSRLSRVASNSPRFPDTSASARATRKFVCESAADAPAIPRPCVSTCLVQRFYAITGIAFRFLQFRRACPTRSIYLARCRSIDLAREVQTTIGQSSSGAPLGSTRLLLAL